ncbi:tetratricopeptide repeat protein [Pasteurellaceae bacterium HPA106]|uniref:YfgM family protein n=1 Tax=Spirabiliibacterium pneumoniae TaxID=221400 RepID=UPI001AAD7552|nr:tetratricopeptide repeat protein [Spirabiliibacterium pneumoniae]MBE2896201.1 tetratricopeptide repeat protein [Spirabiliibacterium pneumoniae]
MSYITEEQQVEELKSWWKENSKVIITTLILVFASVLGWRYWQNYQLNSRLEASNDYEQVLSAYQKDPKNNAGLLSQFVKEHEGSSYAVFALFEQAKSAVEHNQLEQAQAYLTQAQQISKDSELKATAAIRLASVQLQAKQFEAAIGPLNGVGEAAYYGVKQRLLGEAYLGLGDKEKAKAAFEAALKTPNLDQLDKDLIQLRLNNL